MSSPEIRKKLRRKALWTVGDFAIYMGGDMTHKQALAQLKRYDEELGGRMFRRTRGTNRRYMFFWAALAKHDPDAFVDDPIEMQQRMDIVEDTVGEMKIHQRNLAAQTGQNTRDISRLQQRKGRAA